MRKPSDTAGAFLLEAIDKVAAELEHAGLVPAGHSSRFAGETSRAA